MTKDTEVSNLKNEEIDKQLLEKLEDIRGFCEIHKIPTICIFDRKHANGAYFMRAGGIRKIYQMVLAAIKSDMIYRIVVKEALLHFYAQRNDK